VRRTTTAILVVAVLNSCVRLSEQFIHDVTNTLALCSLQLGVLRDRVLLSEQNKENFDSHAEFY